MRGNSFFAWLRRWGGGQLRLKELDIGRGVWIISFSDGVATNSLPGVFICKTLDEGFLKGGNLVKYKIHSTFSQPTSCLEGTAAEKTELAAARAKRILV